ncbi:hypothetical protein G5I_09627 [Acromyrmex echinatior]|uniref:Uncharacterized protein n=1 Tax=Acromyrmex echinatior TaxID=103372 RepID=F4WUQ0_ACREC|nr:hypothetical protein G5I_09627 [Acromyrmex echinatior]
MPLGCSLMMLTGWTRNIRVPLRIRVVVKAVPMVPNTIFSLTGGEHCRLRLKAVCHVPALILTNANDKRRRVHLSYLQRMISHTSSREAARIVRDPVFNLRIERRISFVRRLNGWQALPSANVASNIDKVSGYRRRTRFSRGPCWANGAATEH